MGLLSDSAGRPEYGLLVRHVGALGGRLNSASRHRVVHRSDGSWFTVVFSVHHRVPHCGKKPPARWARWYPRVWNISLTQDL